MRASRRIQGGVPGSKSGMPSKKGRPYRPALEHISGAEGIYEASQIESITAGYLRRALDHPRGAPDRITVTVEKIGQKPLLIAPLPFLTLQSESPEESAVRAARLLKDLGITSRAIHQAFRVLRAPGAMRGASLVLCRSGRRVEPDRKRGVRVSMLGIRGEAVRLLSARLAKQGLNNPTVREAIVLASKVASCKEVLAEICISDDPDYTTGYVSARRTGYLRIPLMKPPGSRSGGRVFFLEEDADIAQTISYLEERPVIVGSGRSGGMSRGA